MINGPLAPVTDEQALKRAYSCFPSGVVAVCAQVPDIAEPVGMSASAFTTVSLAPPLVTVCVRRESQTWTQLRSAPAIGVNVFAAHQGDICRTMAGPPETRFTGLETIGDPSGAIFLPDATAHLQCTVHAEVDAGDHILVLLRIEALRSDPSREPLVFHASTFRALEARRQAQ